MPASLTRLTCHTRSWQNNTICACRPLNHLTMSLNIILSSCKTHVEMKCINAKTLETKKYLFTASNTCNSSRRSCSCFAACFSWLKSCRIFCHSARRWCHWPHMSTSANHRAAGEESAHRPAPSRSSFLNRIEPLWTIGGNLRKATKKHPIWCGSAMKFPNKAAHTSQQVPALSTRVWKTKKSSFCT